MGESYRLELIVIGTILASLVTLGVTVVIMRSIWRSEISKTHAVLFCTLLALTVFLGLYFLGPVMFALIFFA